MMAVLLMIGMVGIQPARPVQAALPTDLFFSEYIEGSSSNKAIEIYNGTGSLVDLSDYSLELYSNGAALPSQTVVLSGTLATGNVFVAAHPDATQAILAQADLLSNSVVNWNGDDTIALRKISTNLFVDVIGQIGYRPPSGYWGRNPFKLQTERWSGKQIFALVTQTAATLLTRLPSGMLFQRTQPPILARTPQVAGSISSLSALSFLSMLRAPAITRQLSFTTAQVRKLTFKTTK